ncbi:MAG: lipoprotein [Gammaproteobacteria bacterium]|nr:lipoprotein [Gammaproteobacteria bacterium]
MKKFPLAALIAAGFLLASCGQSGPLYLPGGAPAQSAFQVAAQIIG